MSMLVMPRDERIGGPGWGLQGLIGVGLGEGEDYGTSSELSFPWLESYGSVDTSTSPAIYTTPTVSTQDSGGSGFDWSKTISDVIGSAVKTAGSVLTQQNLARGVYVQGANGQIYYTQPEGNKANILSASTAQSTTTVGTGTAAKMTDTSTVLMVGLGIVGVMVIANMSKGRG